MADDFTPEAVASPGTITFAADDVGGKLFPRTKIVIGADGVNDGDVSSTNALPVTASALPLPSGAATAAKQPALGTAGTASADVLSVQGIASGVALPVSAAGGTLIDLGAKADAAATTDTGTFSLIALFKRLLSQITALLPAALSAGGNLKVSLQETNATQAVSGSVSVSSLPNTTLAGQTANTADFDTGAGTVTVPMLGVALPASGGPVAGGTATNPIRVDVTGTTNQPVTIAASQTLATVTTVGTVTTLTGGNVAHDGADSGNPHKIGGKATSSQTGQTLVADGDRVDAAFFRDGALSVRPIALENLVNGKVALTTTTASTILSAGASGVKQYVTDVVICNTSATSVTVDLQPAGGSAVVTLPAPSGGGVVFSFASPIGFAAATAIEAKLSASASTVTVTVSGFTSKI